MKYLNRIEEMKTDTLLILLPWSKAISMHRETEGRT